VLGTDVGASSRTVPDPSVARAPSEPAPGGDRLRPHALGLPQVLFQSIAFMGPAAGIALSMLVVVALVGPLVPLAFLLAAIGSVLVAICIGQLAKQSPSAGGVYTYVAASLGPAVGFVVGWLLVLFLSLVPPLIFIALAFVMGGVVPEIPWFAWVLLAAVVVAALNVRDVRLSTNVGMALGLAELGLFTALAIWMIVANAGENTVRVFDPSLAGPGGAEGILRAAALAFVSFVGFESAAVLGEEAQRPRWTIPRAVVLSALAVGAFYLLASYATVVGFGFDAFTDEALASGNPWTALGERYWGAGWVLILFALINSMVGVANAAVIAASRVAFAMGRAGVLPGALARIHSRFRTPHVAIGVVAVTGAGLALLAGLAWDLLTAAGIIATGVAIPALVIYLVACVATTVAYARQHRPEFSPLLHGLIPVAGIAVLAAPLVVQVIPFPEPPISYATWLAIGWLLAGIGIAGWLWAARRETLARTRLLFVEDAADQPAEERTV
jgi:amino acid transporter